MGIAHRQTKLGVIANTAASLAITFDTPTLAGSGIQVCISEYSPGVTFNGVSDNKGNVFVEDTGGSPALPMVSSAHSDAHLRAFRCENIVGGSGHTVTVAYSGNAYATVTISEITGQALSGARDKTKTSEVDSNGLHDTGASATLAQPNELIVGFGGTCADTAPCNFAISGGSYTQQSNTSFVAGTSMGLVIGTKVVASTAPVSFVIDTIGVQNKTLQALVTWKEAAQTHGASGGPLRGLAKLVAAALRWTPTIRYIATAGSDAADGKTPATAWRTFTNVNSLTLMPGDAVLLREGDAFTGPLLINGKGTPDLYIRVGTYNASGVSRIQTASSVPNFYAGGAGDPWPGLKWLAQANPATINAPDVYPGGVKATDCEYIWFDNIAVVGSGVNSVANSPIAGQPIGYSASLACGWNLKNTTTANKLRGVRLTACSATGVRWGFQPWGSSASVRGWDNLEVSKCSFHDCQWTAWQGPVGWDLDLFAASGTVSTYFLAEQSSNNYVGYCSAYNVPGDGTHNAIAFGWFYSDGGLVEYCDASRVQMNRNYINVAGTCGFQYTQGVTNFVMQFCEAWGVRTTAGDSCDGGGFESEPNNTNTWRYCYAHDNDGGGFVTAGGKIQYCVSANNLRDPNHTTAVNTVRGEISQSMQDDPTSVLVVENCTIIATQTGGLSAHCAIGTGNPNFASGAPSSYGKVYLYNNVLVCHSGETCVEAYDLAAALGNVYYANGGPVTIKNYKTSATYTTLAAFRAAGVDKWENYASSNYGAFADPLLRSPGSAPSTGTLPANPVASLGNFDLTLGSPAINAGIDYALLSLSAGSIDFRARANFRDGAYEAGAVEYINHATTSATRGVGAALAAATRRYRQFPTTSTARGTLGALIATARRYRQHTDTAMLGGYTSLLGGVAQRTHARHVTGTATGATGRLLATSLRTTGAPPPIAHATSGAISASGAFVLHGAAAHLQLHVTSGALAAAMRGTHGLSAILEEHMTSGVLAAAMRGTRGAARHSVGGGGSGPSTLFVNPRFHNAQDGRDWSNPA